jgi:hypothetical protein
VYWLRRIPPETRIVVLVVFLALFQAILLSVFGISAIRGERRNVVAELEAFAKDALELLAGQSQNGFKERADQALRAVFDRRDHTGLADDLFIDAFAISADQRVYGADADPLWVPQSKERKNRQRHGLRNP